jgi:hypothetical protein
MGRITNCPSCDTDGRLMSRPASVSFSIAPVPSELPRGKVLRRGLDVGAEAVSIRDLKEAAGEAAGYGVGIGRSGRGLTLVAMAAAI